MHASFFQRISGYGTDQDKHSGTQVERGMQMFPVPGRVRPRFHHVSLQRSKRGTPSPHHEISIGSSFLPAGHGHSGGDGGASATRRRLLRQPGAAEPLLRKGRTRRIADRRRTRRLHHPGRRLPGSRTALSRRPAPLFTEKVPPQQVPARQRRDRRHRLRLRGPAGTTRPALRTAGSHRARIRRQRQSHDRIRPDL